MLPDVKYSPRGRLVRIGPNTKADSATTMKSCGNILSILFAINVLRLTVFESDFVTYNPLKKKKTLTAKPPEPHIYPPNSVGKAILSPVIEPECPIMTNTAQINLSKLTLLLLMLNNSDRFLFIMAIVLTKPPTNVIVAKLCPIYEES